MKNALLVVLCCLPASAFAQAEELENPGTVSAVQDRKFRMGQELTLGIGVLPVDAFYKGLTANVSYTSHFSDTFAWQIARGFYSYNLSTGLRQQLIQSFGASPVDFDEVQFGAGSSVMWTPLYGKMAWLNGSVAHFQIFGLAGASVLRLSRAGFRPAINFGIGMRVFLNKNVSFRLDVTDDLVIAPDRILLNVMSIQLAVAINFGATE
ncbi:MAG: outer membrane beta-barrel domain-containing protein [Myxococcaceae bacterium]